MKEKSTLAKNIQQMRKTRGLSQQQFAARLGVSIGAIIDYENGRREPNCRALVALERFFGVSGSTLVGPEREAAPEAVEAPCKAAALSVPGYQMGLDISEEDGTGVAVICEGCGEAILAVTFEPDQSGIRLRLPQQCPKCGGVYHDH